MCLNDQYQCNQRNQLILQIKGLLQWIAQASYTHKRWSTNWKMSFAQLSGILGPAANASMLAAWSHLPWSNGKIMYVPWYWVVRQACLYGPIHTVWLSVFRKLSESRVFGFDGVSRRQVGTSRTLDCGSTCPLSLAAVPEKLGHQTMFVFVLKVFALSL